MRTIPVPVLIVGAGPVGLATALDLGWRGISCLILDQEPDQHASIDVHPRAAAITPRTMEFCRRWGVAGQVRDSGFPRDYTPNIVYCTSLTGHELLTQRFASMRDRKPLAQSPESRERCPQIWFDPILKRALAPYRHVQLQRPWQLESFCQHPDGVKAQVIDLAREERISIDCKYLIACDGPTSSIRESLDISSSGEGLLSYSVNAVLDIPDFFSYHDKGQAERYLFMDSRGAWANLTVIDGRERFRFTLTGTKAALDRGTLDLPGVIRTALGADIPFNIVAIAPWRRRQAVADRFSVGRVFLAGDAAHTIPPNLGLGMNLGLGDSVDLGWKIEAMLRGWGGPRLLDSYEAERRPVALHIAAASTEAYRRWMSSLDSDGDILADGEQGRSARAQAAERLAKALPDGWDTLGLQLGYRYEGSPICISDGTPAPLDDGGFSTYLQTGRPGARAPHAWLEDGRSTIDLFGRGFTLLRFRGSPDAAELIRDAAQKGVPLSVVDIADIAVRDLYGADLVLVRPDGHVAWRADDLALPPRGILDHVLGG